VVSNSCRNMRLLIEIERSDENTFKIDENLGVHLLMLQDQGCI